MLGQRVLLIDLDSQGHCAVGRGMKPRLNEPSIHNLFVDPAATLSEAVRPTTMANQWLAPADPFFDQGSGTRNDLRLRSAISDEGLTEQFDFIAFDTPWLACHLAGCGSRSLQVRRRKAAIGVTRSKLRHNPSQTASATPQEAPDAACDPAGTSGRVPMRRGVTGALVSAKGIAR